MTCPKKLKMSKKEAHRHYWYKKYDSVLFTINFPWFFWFFAWRTTLILTKSANCWNFLIWMTIDFRKKLKLSKKEAHWHSWYKKYVSAFYAINFPWFFWFFARRTTLILSKSANCQNFLIWMTMDFWKKLKMS